MKKILLYLPIIILFISLYSCITTGTPITKKPAENNKTYNVEYLFENDGCKVYRFYDNGNYVYFVNCNGSAMSISNDSVKTRVQSITAVKP